MSLMKTASVNDGLLLHESVKRQRIKKSEQLMTLIVSLLALKPVHQGKQGGNGRRINNGKRRDKDMRYKNFVTFDELLQNI